MFHARCWRILRRQGGLGRVRDLVASIGNGFAFSVGITADRKLGEVDLRKLNRHRDATIEKLIPVLSCRRCVPNPTFAKLYLILGAEWKRIMTGVGWSHPL
jgi:hypothetical protein